jgi:MoxR-like ATPase
MATQNPIENEGVYPLPEAQLDRFMLKIKVGYNTPDEELLIARRIASKSSEPIHAVVNAQVLQELQEKVKTVHIDEEVERYMIALVGATREPERFGLESIKRYIQFGASPRVSIDMFKAVRAMAFLRGKEFVAPSDIASIVKDLMRHRIVLSYEAEAEGIDVDTLIEQIVTAVPVP